MNINAMFAHISYDVEFLNPNIMVDPAETLAYQSNMRRLGTKNRPFECDISDHHMHIDGISAEMAPCKPLSNPTAMMNCFLHAKEVYENYIRAPLVGADWVDLQDIKGFGRIETPWLYKQTMEFGCSPDYLNGKKRNVPNMVRRRSLRELGLHIHFDLLPEYRDQREAHQIIRGDEPTNARICAKVANEIHQATSYMFHSRHPSERLWYRRPALYRPTKYGIEYRTFGSEICNDTDRLRMFFQVCYDYMVNHFAGSKRVTA